MPDDEFAGYLKKHAYTEAMAEDMQVIPARHGTATFVPSGSSIKIINTSGTQVIDTWAFALPSPPKKKDGAEGEKKADKPEEKKEEPKPEPKKEEPKAEAPKPTPKKGKKGKDLGLPSQEEAEQMTKNYQKQVDEEEKAADGTPKKAGWSSYLPSLRGKPATEEQKQTEAAKTKENSKTWGSYFSAGKGFTNYIPNKDSISTFASTHYRDPNKSYTEQLADFSKTPVGAAGMSALSGSGYASSLYAGYSAWNAENAPSEPPMEFLSMPHTRAATCHLVPKVNDVLVSNLREPMLTLVEDTSPGIHDTLIAACDPQRYHGLGVEKWEEHGSCAENLVLALKELNEKAGLKGAKGIGADVTVNAVPAPFNLFMNIPWTDKGELDFASPGGKAGDYVRFRAERDCVVIMSACPQDVLAINAKSPKDGHFVVEENSDDENVKAKLQKAEQEKKAKKPKAAPKKLGTATNGTAKPAAKKPAPKAAGAKATGAKPAAKKPAPKTPAAKTPAAKAPEAKAPEAKTPEVKEPETKATESKTPAAETPSAPGADKAEGTLAPPVEKKKKPRKLQKRGSVQTDAKSVTTEAKSEGKSEA